MKIAILGWGSLLWDHNAHFDAQRNQWLLDGPDLKLEFSRVSKSRGKALTLVIDSQNGELCRVAYTISKRKDPEDAICDLRAREGTTRKNIGIYSCDGSRHQGRDADSLKAIADWCTIKKVDVVVWTDLESNFKIKSTCANDFSIQNALLHIKSLDAEGKAQAAEYVWRTPDFVQTPLRKVLEGYPWF